MSIKIQSIGALFVALVIILAINPTIVHNMYGSILGRLFLVLIVIYSIFWLFYSLTHQNQSPYCAISDR